ncbi:MAG TPA: hypothetical protein VN696_11495 [Pyrinomonadaceae bacterium]|jgi:hypothetical protein|nr:hypothetical protein [Pyrinomonadaceae bacterium]
MTIRMNYFALLFSIFVLVVTAAGQTTSKPNPINDGSTEPVATQLGLLRHAVQSLDATLGDISDKFLPLYAKAKEAEAENENRISGRLALLTQAEQRAELLRRQLLELIEKETAYRTRIAQIDEDMRPENIERTLNPYGTTRTAELRDNRRRVLENERKGQENLLNVAASAHMRLEEDVRQADDLVRRLRQKLMPEIDRAIDKINSEKP